jgi:hypothetical protein
VASGGRVGVLPLTDLPKIAPFRHGIPRQRGVILTKKYGRLWTVVQNGEVMSTAEIETARESTNYFTGLSPIDLYEEDGARKLRFIFRNGEVVDESAETVAHYIKQLHTLRGSKEKQKESIAHQIALLSERLTQWCRDNSAHLFMPYLALSDVKDASNLEVYFFAVQNSNEHNEDFSRNLTRLEMEIEDSTLFSTIDLKVMELPKMDEDAVRKFMQDYTTIQ